MCGEVLIRGAATTTDSTPTSVSRHVGDSGYADVEPAALALFRRFPGLVHQGAAFFCLVHVMLSIRAGFVVQQGKSRRLSSIGQSKAFDVLDERGIRDAAKAAHFHALDLAGAHQLIDHRAAALKPFGCGFGRM